MAGIPALFSFIIGMLVFRASHDVTVASLTAGFVGWLLALALSIRGGEPLFCMIIGCSILTMMATSWIKMPPEPNFFVVLLGILFAGLFLLGLRLLLEAVMPRADQLAD